jgi:membrane-associated protein
VWADGILLAGYLSARKLRDTVGASNIDKYILPAVAVIVVVSVIPIFVEVLRNRRERRNAPGRSGGRIDRDAPAADDGRVDDSTQAARAGEPRQ